LCAESWSKALQQDSFQIRLVAHVGLHVQQRAPRFAFAEA
jgi:hypothetical protein